MRLLYLAAAFMAGVFLAGRYGLPLPALGLFVIAALMLGALLGSMRRSLMPALLVLVLLLGMFRVEIFEGDQTSALVEYHSRHSLQVRGLVVSDPEPAGAFTRFRLRVESVNQDDDWIDVSGDALVTLRASSALARLRDRPYFRYGDRLLLEGALEAPPVLEEFDYPAYLARQGIVSVMSFPDSTLLDEGQGALFYRWLYGTRRSIADSLARLVPEPQASMGQALLLGIRDNLPDELIEDFRVTGTSHILAISGLHVGILLGISLIVSQWLLGRRRHIYLLMPLILMWLYALISGMSPSVTRAAIMGSVYLVALLVGRPRSVLPALGLAAAVMVAVSPGVLLSLSFQLSFAAMVGITSVMSLVGKARSRTQPTILSTLITWLMGAIAISIAATLATLPLIAFYFERVSLVGILATLLVMPALPLALAAHAIAGILGLFATWPAQLFGWIAWAATAYITGVVGLIARFPVASVGIGWVSPVMVWAYYGLFALFFARKALRRAVSWVVERVRGLPSLPLGDKSVSWWILAPVISIAAMTWVAALSLPDSRLHVAFIDVGQGDAAFITTPDGHQIVVDGGPDPMELVRFLGDNMPFRDRTIEIVRYRLQTPFLSSSDNL
ncbi:MAG: ComEC/Rec2 family competence protein [Chloroflexi bacterium]|nr:ComEC/Rec2 family competence protein [Chloroflexota bacterium]